MSYTVKRLVRDMRSRERAARADQPAQGVDFRDLREHNRLLVLNCVRAYGPLARVAIAHRTGLSRTTVSSIIDALLHEGFVREGSTVSAAPGGGRRAILVHFNAEAGRILGVDMGRTHYTLLLTNLSADILAGRSGALDADLGPDVCVPILLRAIRALVADEGLTWEAIAGIGLGIPGPLDARTHTLHVPPRMPGWDGIDIQQILSRELHVPTYVENDANLGALGEARYGAGRGISDMAYVKIGTGIGCGLVLNGQFYRGSTGSAGELGHVTLDSNGPACDCGNRGCLEVFAGGPAILDDARKGLSLATRHTPATTAVFPSQLNDLADVVYAAQNGNAACVAAIEAAGERIGVALAGLINLFNPSVILVDGGVARAGELLLAPLRRTAAARSLPAAWARTAILPGKLGENAIALGAVTTVIDAAFRMPSVATAAASDGWRAEHALSSASAPLGAGESSDTSALPASP